MAIVNNSSSNVSWQNKHNDEPPTLFASSDFVVCTKVPKTEYDTLVRRNNYLKIASAVFITSILALIIHIVVDKNANVDRLDTAAVENHHKLIDHLANELNTTRTRFEQAFTNISNNNHNNYSNDGRDLDELYERVVSIGRSVEQTSSELRQKLNEELRLFHERIEQTLAETRAIVGETVNRSSVRTDEKINQAINQLKFKLTATVRHETEVASLRAEQSLNRSIAEVDHLISEVRIMVKQSNANREQENATSSSNAIQSASFLVETILDFDIDSLTRNLNTADAYAFNKPVTQTPENTPITAMISVHNKSSPSFRIKVGLLDKEFARIELHRREPAEIEKCVHFIWISTKVGLSNLLQSGHEEPFLVDAHPRLEWKLSNKIILLLSILINGDLFRKTKKTIYICFFSAGFAGIEVSDVC